MTEKNFESSGEIEDAVEYELAWRNKFLTIDATSLDEMIDGLQSAVNELREMCAGSS